MKKKIGYRIVLVFTVLCMAGIFLFSSKPSDESSEMSHEVGLFLCRILIPDFEDWTMEDQNALADRINFPVRKTAHATEYAVLGMLIFGTLLLGDWNVSAIRKLRAAVMLGAAYAVTDEIHQIFVPGRACKMTDVLIDTAGVAVGAFLIIALTKIKKKENMPKKKREKSKRDNKTVKGKQYEQ